MYPGPNKSPQNHKRGYCSDGCPVSFDRFAKSKGEESKTQQSSRDSPPPYPQPDGVFIDGESFSCTHFLRSVKDVYERAVMQETNQAVADFTVEDQAFASMLEARVSQLPDGAIVFRLYEGLRLDSAIASEMVVEIDGVRYLRVKMMEHSRERGLEVSG